MVKATKEQIITMLENSVERYKKSFLKEADISYNMRGNIGLLLKRMKDPKCFIIDIEVIEELEEIVNVSLNTK